MIKTDEIIEEAILTEYGDAISDIDSGNVRYREYEDEPDCCRVVVWLDGRELMRLLIDDYGYEILERRTFNDTHHLHHD